VQLVSKISNLCDPDPPTLQTDRQTDGQTDGRTTCNLNTALCTSASCGKNIHGAAPYVESSNRRRRRQRKC